ncbi:JmjC domain-containing protein [Sphingorhabdus arenilitoris]|uniref:JmjC domain-containing protein n=1 Tax=Sphingorhabdus arenilitoris TaxID=1490041 RepID=A0ABV8RGY5_9SPHN
MQLTHFDPDVFLRDYWQKKPMLIRGAFDNWQNPLTPDELAGLACEAEVESRLVVQDADGPRAEFGPFSDSRFAEMGLAPWTLLVQAVDHFSPEVAALIAPFRFIPDWRIDDVMVSYATDGGGVGAHFDQYDVFLIQGLGRRRWQVGGACNGDSPLVPHDDLRLLADFEVQEEWLLEPGDMLYVPPGISHNGIAVGDDCMTYSVGFRAPSAGEMLGDYCDHIIETMAADPRYTDPDLTMQGNAGEISPDAIARLHDMVIRALSDRAEFARWFGRYSSLAKYPEIDWAAEEKFTENSLITAAANGAVLLRNPAARLAFIEQEGGNVMLFADGQEFACTDAFADFARLLCANMQADIDTELLNLPGAAPTLVTLLNQGIIAFSDA